MSTAKYALGVDLGTTYTCAAIADDGPPRVVQLTGTSQTIPSVVSKTDNGMLAGEAAERRLTTHPAATAREFKRRFGDPAPMVLDGQAFGADALTAELLGEVIRRVRTVEGEPPSIVALAHPASWGPFRLDLLRSAATQAGVTDVQLVSEPVAAAVANRDRMPDGSLVAVYDLGGGTFDAAVVRCEGDWSVVGTPEGVERLGGIDFDQAILAHVDAALDGQVFMLDSSEPDARSALMQLRAECQAAKEHLSQDTDVEIPVSLPNLRTSVRLTRAEFESMVRPRLADSLSVLDRVVASAGASWDDIAGVLLVGGSSNIPAVGQLVGEHTGRPVISATNPHLAIALGTAAIAQHGIARTEPVSSLPPTSSDSSTSAPIPTVTPKRPVGLIVAAVVALAAVIGAFVVLSGGDDATDDSNADVGVAPSAPSATAGPTDVTTAPEVASSAAPATAETTVPTVNPAPDAAVTVEMCAADAGDALRFGVTESGLYVVTPAEIKRVENADLAACAIDVPAAQDAGIDPPIAATDVAGYGAVLALSAPSGGIVINQATGIVVSCAGLTGSSSVTDEGDLYVIDGDVISPYTLDRTGCTPADAAPFAGVAATSIAAGGGNRVAVTGADRSSGTTQLWVSGGGNAVVAVDGVGSADGVIRCGDSWCVVDVAADVIHVLDLDGSIVGETPLSAGLPAPVTDLLDLTSGDSAGTFALVQLGDGSTTILRLDA